MNTGVIVNFQFYLWYQINPQISVVLELFGIWQNSWKIEILTGGVFYLLNQPCRAIPADDRMNASPTRLSPNSPICFILNLIPRMNIIIPSIPKIIAGSLNLNFL